MVPIFYIKQLSLQVYLSAPGHLELCAWSNVCVFVFTHACSREYVNMVRRCKVR